MTAVPTRLRKFLDPTGDGRQNAPARRSGPIDRLGDPQATLDAPRLGRPLEGTDFAETGLDRGEMAVTSVVSTDVEDRSCDIVVTKGISIEHHRRNPIWLLDHGDSGWTLPIGKAEDPDGGYTVKHRDGYLLATCHFAQNDRVSRQTFALIDEGVLRGTSIGFIPIELSTRHGDHGEQGRLIKRCQLLEISYTPLPDNPECAVTAAGILHRGKVGGEPLTPTIMKMLDRLSFWRKSFHRTTPAGQPGPNYSDVLFEARTYALRQKAETLANEVRRARN